MHLERLLYPPGLLVADAGRLVGLGVVTGQSLAVLKMVFEKLARREFSSSGGPPSPASNLVRPCQVQRSRINRLLHRQCSRSLNSM